MLDRMCCHRLGSEEKVSIVLRGSGALGAVVTRQYFRVRILLLSK